MYNILNTNNELIASFKYITDAQKFAEERSYFEPVTLDNEIYDFEYPKKIKRFKNGN